jgi:hypothetical protein
MKSASHKLKFYERRFVHPQRKKSYEKQEVSKKIIIKEQEIYFLSYLIENVLKNNNSLINTLIE